MANGARAATAVGLEGCELTILMPCLNEAETIGTCVRKARAFLQRARIVGEVLIADNGSTDGSRDIAMSHGARVVTIARPGYGNALRGGIAAARGHCIIVGDADDSYDFSALDPFVERLREGFDLVMGNRFQGGIDPGAMPFLHRRLGNPILSGLGRLFFHSPVGDFHCGLRGFRRDAVAALGLAAPGMEFASEMVVKATLHGLRITEVPSRLFADGRSRRPHLRSWRDGWRHLRFLLLLSPRWLFLYPGALLMLAGLGAMVWLLPGPRQIHGITFDLHTLAFSAGAIICGFQAVVFAIFTKMHAIDAGLLPPDPRIAALERAFRLEVGIIVGLALLAAGIGASLYVIGAWGASSFEPMDPAVSMRVVLPALTALVLGLQIIFSSFFFGILDLSRQ